MEGRNARGARAQGPRPSRRAATAPGRATAGGAAVRASVGLASRSCGPRACGPAGGAPPRKPTPVRRKLGSPGDECARLQQCGYERPRIVDADAVITRDGDDLRAGNRLSETALA